MFSKRKFSIICLALALAMFAAGCKKKVPAPAPPPPPPPVVQPPAAAAGRSDRCAVHGGAHLDSARPVVPHCVGKSPAHVTSVSINQGVGTVQSTGSSRVSPSDSTTYTLTATGPGGSVTSSATVNVSAPPPPPPPPPPPAPTVTIDQRLGSDVQDAYFDYDKTDIRSDARDALSKNAAALKSILSDFPNASIVIEGHCDERGSAEYNLGLGDRRASAAKEFLQGLGVPADRLKTISYGKERPQCTEQNETCWQKNRRVHFVAGQ